MNKRLCSIHCHKVRPCLPGQQQRADCATCLADGMALCMARLSTLQATNVALPITGKAICFLRLLHEDHRLCAQQHSR